MLFYFLFVDEHWLSPQHRCVAHFNCDSAIQFFLSHGGTVAQGIKKQLCVIVPPWFNSRNKELLTPPNANKPISASLQMQETQ
jgi:hypothetical protein